MCINVSNEIKNIFPNFTNPIYSPNLTKYTQHKEPFIHIF